jgi:hypothetical protein
MSLAIAVGFIFSSKTLMEVETFIFPSTAKPQGKSRSRHRRGERLTRAGAVLIAAERRRGSC